MSRTPLQADTAACPLRKISCKALVFITVLESRVHGAHEHPIPECGETEIQWCEEVGVICRSQFTSFLTFANDDCGSNNSRRHAVFAVTENSAVTRQREPVLKFPEECFPS